MPLDLLPVVAVDEEIEQAITEARKRDQELRNQAARVVVSLAVGLLMESLFDPQIADWQLEARQSLELLMNGLARRVE